MLQNRKTIILLSLLTIVIITTASTISTGPKYKNLQVLPRDISEKKLDSMMDAYNKALKVSCDFCHIKAKKDVFSIAPPPDELDFALDNPMKEEARRMIKLQMDINTKYFYNDSTIKPVYLNVVGCNTCHRGNPYPAYE